MSERKFQEIPDEGGGFFVNFNNPGDAAEGTLKSVRDTDTKFGTQKCYDLITDDGEECTLGGCYDLDTKFASIKVGDYVRVTFRESRPLNGGKTVKKFKVEVAPGNGKVPEPKKQVNTADVPF